MRSGLSLLLVMLKKKSGYPSCVCTVGGTAVPMPSTEAHPSDGGSLWSMKLSVSLKLTASTAVGAMVSEHGGIGDVCVEEPPTPGIYSRYPSELIYISP